MSVRRFALSVIVNPFDCKQSVIPTYSDEGQLPRNIGRVTTVGIYVKFRQNHSGVES